MPKRKTNPTAPPDKRLTYTHQRIEHEGNAWYIDAKYDPITSTLKVYRVYGDITDKALYEQAIQLWLHAEVLRLTTAPRKPGRPRK